MSNIEENNSTKKVKGKKALGIVFSIIAILVGFACIASEAFGATGFLLLSLLFSNIPISQEITNIAYGISGTGALVGAVSLTCLLFVIMIIVFSSIALKKTDCPKALSIIALLVSILTLLVYIVLVISIIVGIVIVVQGTGLDKLIQTIMSGGTIA